ncbi:MAG TPA: DUF3127 domain-containing protein [Candidatus Paceibacterota bacterium]|nr:DUF3127 domain-containing protein [Candidatus Paceibacterota bacterium]
MQVKGRLIHVGEIETVGQNNMEKRVVAVETEGQYPQQIGIELIKDKARLITEDDNGRDCTIDINLRGREYNGKYYVNLSGWKVEFHGEAQTSDDNEPF